MRSKTLLAFVVVFGTGALTACVPDPASELRSQTWQVVSSNGEAGQMNFNFNTASYTSAEFSRGFSYEVEEGMITFEVEDAGDTSPFIFEIERANQEYILTPENQESSDEFGQLTLAPTEE